jgi:hypothetical protein
MRDHQGIHVVIVRFLLNDDTGNSSKNRFAAANDWINRLDAVFQGMGE